jgi:hypothetical protein
MTIGVRWNFRTCKHQQSVHYFPMRQSHHINHTRKLDRRVRNHQRAKSSLLTKPPYEASFPPSSSRPTPLAIHSAMAMLVIMGFTPLALGKTLASATKSPSVPQTRP